SMPITVPKKAQTMRAACETTAAPKGATPARPGWSASARSRPPAIAAASAAAAASIRSRVAAGVRGPAGALTSPSADGHARSCDRASRAGPSRVRPRPASPRAPPGRAGTGCRPRSGRPPGMRARSSSCGCPPFPRRRSRRTRGRHRRSTLPPRDRRPREAPRPAARAAPRRPGRAPRRPAIGNQPASSPFPIDAGILLARRRTGLDPGQATIALPSTAIHRARMDFSLSPELADLRDRTREFIRDEVIPFERDPRRTSHGPTDELRRELNARARAAGLLAPHVERRLGGLGLGHVGRAIVFEEAGYSMLGPIALHCAAPDEGNMHLLSLVATPAQQRRWLEPLAAAETRSCFCMTE